ncbi:hypothetical protein MGN70_003876 [Eutypa lata]|nr:hypothetical protein MGN70_003876 [Eutypa lata]
MRLINTQTLQLQTFETSPPPYAILSHTWGPEETTFEDFQDRASTHGLDHAWVDACCCIDKSSSAELSEAINSMFAWYRDSARRLLRVPGRRAAFRSPGAAAGDTRRDLARQFRRSRLVHARLHAAGADRAVAPRVLGAPLRDIYVAKRMHELDRVPGDRPPARKTRRTVLYCTVLPDGHLRGQPKCRCCTDGEGPKQGIRPPPLQENILMQKDDHSLFACANPDRLGASPLHVRQQTVYVVATTSSYFFDVLAIPPGQADEAAWQQQQQPCYR